MSYCDVVMNLFWIKQLVNSTNTTCFVNNS